MSRLRIRLLNPRDRAQYDDLMNRLHYLGAAQSHLVKALQYVIEDATSGEWLALADWGYCALKNRVRDDWVGWSEELRDARLKYVATNTRFLILPAARTHGHRFIASQSLALMTQRISADWARYHGNHLLLAETFVDIKRFAGTCYRAANWVDVGLTAGFARSNKRYVEHGDKKRVFVFPLVRRARELLCSTGVPHMLLTARREVFGSAIDVNRLPLTGSGGLLDALAQVRDGRFRRGVRYKLPSILALTVSAVLSGIDSFRGIAEFGVNLPEVTRRKLGFRRGKAPDEETVRLTLNKIDAAQFDGVVRAWINERCPSLKGKMIAIDGKSMRAARTQNDSSPHILNVILHHDGLALAAVQVADKTNEIPVARELLRALPLDKTVVTLDAMHTQRETAKVIVEEKHSDYLMTVKENQKDLLEKLERLPAEAFSPSVLRDYKGSRES